MRHKTRHATRQRYTKTRKQKRTRGGIGEDPSWPNKQNNFSNMDDDDLDDEDIYNEFGKNNSADDFGEFEKYKSSNSTMNPPLPENPNIEKKNGFLSFLNPAIAQPVPQQQSSIPPQPQEPRSNSDFPQENIPPPIRMAPLAEQRYVSSSSSQSSSPGLLDKFWSSLSLAGEKLKNWALERDVNPESSSGSGSGSTNVSQQGGQRKGKRGQGKKNKRQMKIGKQKFSRSLKRFRLGNKKPTTHKRTSSN